MPFPPVPLRSTGGYSHEAPAVLVNCIRCPDQPSVGASDLKPNPEDEIDTEKRLLFSDVLKRWKLFYTIHLENFPNRNPPTCSGEEALIVARSASKGL